MFWCEFCEICQNTLFAEQHRTTVSDYSGNNSSEGSIAKGNCNYETKTKAHLLISARSQVIKKGSPGERIGLRSRLSQISN